MTEERALLLKQLGDAMSDVSEECYYAGWMLDTEFVVPELCRRALASGEPQPWGDGEVTPEQARQLTELASRLGSWADLDEQGIGYVLHDPFPLTPEQLEVVERERAFQSQRG